MMDEAHARGTGRLALAVGVVAVGSACSIATYFAVGGPFGTINDIGNATTGVMSGWLAWRLRGELERQTRNIAVGAAVTGAAVSAVGSALVVSGTTGWFFAGLVSSLGFAGIGAWLMTLNRSRGVGPARAAGLRRIGVVAGALMVIGVAAVPGILLRIDDDATAPGWAWIAFVGWLGIYVAYPIWAVRTGIAATRQPAPERAAAAGSAVAE